jgi:hypothetical protein
VLSCWNRPVIFDLGTFFWWKNYFPWQQ